MNRNNLIQDAKIIAEGTLYSSLANFFIRGFSLVGYSILLSRLSLQDYGTYVLLASFLVPASAVILFGYDRIFVSALAKARGKGNFSRIKGLVREYYGAAVILAVLFFVFSYLLKNWLVRYYDVSLLQYFWLVSFFIIVQLAFNAIQLVLEGYERFKHLSISQSAEALTRNLGIILLASRLDVANVLVIHIVAKAVAVLVSSVFLAKILSTIFRNDVVAEKMVLLKTWREYGKWEISKNIIDQLTAPLKYWLVSLFVNIQGVAVYDFAQKIYSFIVSSLPVKGVIFPIISRTISDLPLSRLIILKSQKYVFFFYALAYAAVIFAAPYVVRIFFSQYSGHVILIYVVLLHLFVEVYKLGQGALIYALSQQKFQFFLFNIGAVLQVVLDISFVYLWGVLGIILSWHLQALSLGIITNSYLARKFNMRLWNLRDLVRFDEYDRMLLIGILENIKSVSARIRGKPVN